MKSQEFIPFIFISAKKTVIFDLDETLIHNKEFNPSDQVDAIVFSRDPNGAENYVYDLPNKCLPNFIFSCGSMLDHM